jgi:hypothetical protein
MAGGKTREYWQTKIRKPLILQKPGTGDDPAGLLYIY